MGMRITRYTGVNISLGVSILGWIIVASGIRYSVGPMGLVQLTALTIGLGVLLGGIGLMLWIER
jgi:hypothetical protein